MYIYSHIRCLSIFGRKYNLFTEAYLHLHFSSLLGSEENSLIGFMFIRVLCLFSGLENWMKHQSIKEWGS